MALPLIQAPSLKKIPNLVHGFTTRQGGVSEGLFTSFNLGWATGDDDDRVQENYQRLAEEIGVNHDRISGVRQVHSGEVKKVDEQTDLAGLMVVNADAMVTDLENVILSIRVADCFPILMIDVRHHAIGAIHAGWRGTLAQVVPHTIETLKKEYGADPGELIMVIGPGIGFAKFEVSLGVASLFEGQMELTQGEYLETETSAYIDLAAINSKLARNHGIRPDRIWNSGLCTYSDQKRFYSYRRDGKHSGRQVGFIGWALDQAG